MDKPWQTVFKAEYLKNGNNGTQAYLIAKPHVSPKTASVEASKYLALTSTIESLKRATDKRVDKLRFSKDQILDNIDVIRQKSLDKEELGTSLKANKEIAELAGLYERGADDKGNYMLLIKSLVVNTTISSGQPPKQLDNEVDAEFEDVQPLDNNEDTGE